MMRIGYLSAALLAAALGCGAQPAVAATQVEVTGYQYLPTGVSGGLEIESRRSNVTLDAGEFLSTIKNLKTGTTSEIASFGLNALIGYDLDSTYAVVPLSEVFVNATRHEEIAALLAHAQGPLTPIQAAAFEVAILAVVNDNIGADFSLTTGNLRVTGNFLTDGVETAAQQYLDNVDGTGSLHWTGNASDVEVLFSDGRTQSGYQIFEASVPEPASWLSMLVGFSVLGIAVRRQRYFGAGRLTA